ncbi:hypothetical protein I307_00032 [Cryptococcus deuterogattii 99/473]|uniref:Uncharacterized protein n=1 Tax=Cryptococcus deuterogattii Ram5 TaxID=1296110 RepID=A0A0D0VGE4_9TREE|nr:hypothetical protein I313_00771 [Cryptococcus deuterogattii Ram5]KIY60233.1 hypothetical protein I307_00032 [Cryptococcus deuterogattii 99/473]
MVMRNVQMMDRMMKRLRSRKKRKTGMKKTMRLKTNPPRNLRRRNPVNHNSTSPPFNLNKPPSIPISLPNCALPRNTIAMLSDSSTNWNLPFQSCANYSSPPRKLKSSNPCGSLGSRTNMTSPRPNRESRRCCI